VVQVPRFQELLAYICENGYEHHVSINQALASAEALSKYLGWLSITRRSPSIWAGFTVRCYAVCDEVEIARERLRETVAEFRQKVYRLIQALLGESPAVYFHQAVDTLVLGRYLYVQGWLHQNGEKTPTAVSEIDALLQIIDDLRADFFKSDLVKLQYRLNLPIGVPIKSEADFFAERIHALENAEVLIENFERLQGFEMELRELRLTDEVQSFQDWAVFGQTEMAAHNVSASLIVDTERLQRLMAV
jgi:hypothetical protein